MFDIKITTTIAGAIMRVIKKHNEEKEKIKKDIDPSSLKKKEMTREIKNSLYLG